MYGVRGRIGLITLASDTSVLPEYQRLMPPGVAIYPAPILLPRGEVTPEALDAMLATDALERAAELLVWAEVQAIVFACTSGSFVHGLGWDQQLIARIERVTGLPATTTATAMLEALRAVGARTVSVATPYLDSLNQIERSFLEANGFEVAAITGFGLGTDAAIGRLGPEDAVRLFREVDRPESNAGFISCTNWHCLSAVPMMEAAFQKPIVTSNQAGAWFVLRGIGVFDIPPESGSLFTHQFAAAPLP